VVIPDGDANQAVAPVLFRTTIPSLQLKKGEPFDPGEVNERSIDHQTQRGGSPQPDALKALKFLHTIGEGFAVVIGHHDAHPAVGQFLNAVDGSDIRVVERRCRARLTEEALALRAVGSCPGVRQDLERNAPAELAVHGPIHDAHPSGAEPFLDVEPKQVAACNRVSVRWAIHPCGGI